jgi:hypothetical protein
MTMSAIEREMNLHANRAKVIEEVFSRAGSIAESEGEKVHLDVTF